MKLSDSLFPFFSVTVGVALLGFALFSPDGEGKTAVIAQGSGLTGGGLVAFQYKLKYGDSDDGD